MSVFRIEGATYRPEQLGTIVATYKAALAEPDTAVELFAALKPVYAGYTLGALQFDCGPAGGVAGVGAGAGADKVDTEAAAGLVTSGLV
ncbi:hypothetical protein D3C76_1505110 [compost metagenome]